MWNVRRFPNPESLLEHLADQDAKRQEEMREASGEKPLFQAIADNLGVPYIRGMDAIPPELPQPAERVSYVAPDAVVAVVADPKLLRLNLLMFSGEYLSIGWNAINQGGWRKLLSLRKTETN